MNTELKRFTAEVAAIADAAALKETFWRNEKKVPFSQLEEYAITQEQIEDAEKRLERFAPYLSVVFPETVPAKGMIESELRAIPRMKERLNADFNTEIAGDLYLKMDSHLPISGSVKARGGIYEVLKYAETLAVKAGLLKETDNYSILAKPEFTKFFNDYTIQVGSTGNLGMSIGIMSAKVGFRVIVHMSSDAKQWKKDLLRSRGVDVIEYETDYCKAVEEGRKNSQSDPMSYFVDDENSVDLFLGYSVAGKRLQRQLEENNVRVDAEHPLFVYIPCGIGGAPGGVSYGLKMIFGDHVHCFFTEPTQACCMLLGMATGLHDDVCVADFNITGRTEADGLAVGRASAFVGRVMEPLLSGISTIEDKRLYVLMRALLETEDIFIEPSACAAFSALIHKDDMKMYVEKEHLEEQMKAAAHIAWATGGSMVPKEIVDYYLSL